MNTRTPIPLPLSLDQTVCLHQNLAGFNKQRLRPRLADDDWENELAQEVIMRRREYGFIEGQRQQVARQLRDVPTDADGFMDWFEDLKISGPGQNDPLFPWLAEHADLDSMRWFLQQEIAGEAGFDDLVALTQVRLPRRAKLELSRNFWDEMGCGHEKGMHGPMLERLAIALSLDARAHTTVAEALAQGNLMSGLASNRRYAYQSIGALGAVEMTAPDRAALVNAGLNRLGVHAEVRVYFQLHASLDVRHSIAWNREVIRPLVADNSALARPIAEGALLRLRAGARCFERYRVELSAYSERVT